MLDHITDHTARACLEALVQLHREKDEKAILTLVRGLDRAAIDSFLGEFLLSCLATVASRRDREG